MAQRVVELKKSELIVKSLYLKKTNAEIAEEYGVDTKDIQKALVDLEIKKSKKAVKDYRIELVYDINTEPSTPNVSTQASEENSSSAMGSPLNESMNTAPPVEEVSVDY